MSRKFLTHIDLTQNEIQNAVIQRLASAPSSPVKGQVYFNSTSNTFQYYDGSSWQTLWVSPNTVTKVSNASAANIIQLSGGSDRTLADYVPSGTGLLKVDSTGRPSIAVSSTDYAPATSGSSALKGNGSGGFANATLNDVGAATADYSLNSHKLTNVSDPTNPQDSATKNYVDTTAQGLSPKQSVQAATAVALPANTYANGSSGVGATLTANANGVLTVDGYTVQLNDRILVQNEATTANNGIYKVTTLGTSSVPYVLTRTNDFDLASQVAGAYVFAENGTANANSGFVCTTIATVTFGTTAINFTQFSGAGEITAGAGLSKSGNTISVENSGILTVPHGGTGVATLTGLVKGNGTSPMTAAVAGTDYAPATSGTNILKGNGSGGFSSAKFTATIGDGSSTSIGVTHGLGTKDVIAQVRDASTDAVVECDITQTSTTVTTFGFASAPASNSLKVVIIG